MAGRKHKIAVQLLIYVPLIFAAYILQAMVFSEFPIGGAKPLILPVAVVGVAAFGDRIRGGIFGLFAGVLCDAALCRPAILFTLLLTLAGIVVGVLFETLLTRGFPSFLLCCAAVLVVSAACQMFSLLVYYDAQPVELLKTAVYQTVYSLIFTVPVYWLTRITGRIAR